MSDGSTASMHVPTGYPLLYAYSISLTSVLNDFLPKRVDDIWAVSNMHNALSEDLNDGFLKKYLEFNL